MAEWSYVSHRQIGTSNSVTDRTILMTVDQAWSTGWWIWKKTHRRRREFFKARGDYRWRNEAGDELRFDLQEILDKLLDTVRAREALSGALDEEIDGPQPHNDYDALLDVIRRKTP